MNSLKKMSEVRVSKTCFWVAVRNIPENLSLGGTENTNNFLFSQQTRLERMDNVQLDKVDHQIIEELSKNGRASFSEIAKAIGSSRDTVNRRYTRLTNAGVFKVSIQINPQVLGYAAMIGFLIRLLPQEDVAKAMEAISTIPDVTYLVKLSGDYDLLVVVLARDFVDLFKMSERLRTTCGIVGMESFTRKIHDNWPREGQHMSTF